MPNLQHRDLVRRAEEQLGTVVAAFAESNLQDQPDRNRVNQLLVEIRNGI